MSNKPVLCLHCNQPARLVTGAIIYPHRPDLSGLNFWQCLPCDAYVGCHKGTQTPLGYPANKTTRTIRSSVHKVLDPIWKKAPQPQQARVRTRLYKWLSENLGIKPDNCHVGMFDFDMCQRTLRLLNRRGPTTQDLIRGG